MLYFFFILTQFMHVRNWEMFAMPSSFKEKFKVKWNNDLKNFKKSLNELTVNCHNTSFRFCSGNFFMGWSCSVASPMPCPQLWGPGFSIRYTQIWLFRGAECSLLATVTGLPRHFSGCDDRTCGMWLHWQSMYIDGRHFSAFVRIALVTHANLTPPPPPPSPH